MKSTRRSYLYSLLACAVFLSVNINSRAETATPIEVLSYKEGQPVASASLKRLDWMVGDWKWQGPVGDMLGGDLHVSPAIHGQMLGAARGASKDNVVMNEIITKTQVGDSIEIHIRHMDKNLHSWEPLDQPTVHKLLKVEKNAFYFDNYTLVKQDNNHYILHLRIANKDGQSEIVSVKHVRIR